MAPTYAKSQIPDHLQRYFRPVEIGLESTLADYLAEMVAVMREVRRVLRDDGTLWLNIGDSYAQSSARGGTSNDAHSVNGPKGFRSSTRYIESGTISARSCGLKPKDLMLVPARLAIALVDDGWYLRSDIIWCLSGGMRVYARTQKGEGPTTIKDLVRLDPATVQLWNGEKWTQVLGWNRSAEPRQALEIELRNGQRIGCTPGHQWPTSRGLIRTDELQPGDIIETTRLPEPSLPESPRAIPDELGYLIGLYLAEGSTDSKGRIQIAGHADEHEQRMSALGHLTDDYGGAVRGYISGNKSTVIVDSPIVLAIVRQYVYGATAKVKGLRAAVWRRSDQFLLHLLQGYITADGHFDARNDRYRLGFTRNDRLAADLRTLCARLGVSLRLAPGTADGFGKQWPVYRGDLRLTQTDHANRRRDGEVVAVRPGKGRQFWDIGVADEPHVFALASGVLTHNSKPNPMPESVRDRPTNAHEHIFLLTKSAKYFYDADAIREPGTGKVGPFRTGRGHLAKQSRSSNSVPDGQVFTGDYDPAGRNARNVWTITPRPFKDAHFATFPPELPERCIKAGSREGDVVLDPFLGSGTTLMVADRLGRDGIGIELNPEYAAMARNRITGDAPMFAHVDGGEGIYAPVSGTKQDALGKSTYTGFNQRWKEANS